jgi:hypothetical protein
VTSKKTVSLVLAALALGWLTLPTAHAQGKQYKFKVKCGRVVLRDKSPGASFVRSELEKVFAQRIQAVKDKNAEIQIAQVSPDYSARLPNGQTLNYEQITNYMRRGASQFVSVTDLSITIEDLIVRGNEAIVDARQRFARTQRLRDGKIHKVVTGVLQREIWVRTAEGWRLRSVDNLREQSMIVDGRPFDPNNP